MRITSRFVRHILNGIWKITGREPALCPKCKKLMQSHGRCLRYFLMPDGGRTQLSLRVFFCDACCRYHRELPDFLIPHKYHCAKTVASAYDKNELDCDAEDSTIRRLRQWVIHFLELCDKESDSLKHRPFSAIENNDEKSNVNSILPTLKLLVELLVNSGSWIVVH